MSSSLEQIGKDKKEYYGKLRQCLVVEPRTIGTLEKLVSNLKSSEKQVGIALLDTYRITLPLQRAYLEMLLEYFPDWIEDDCRNYPANADEFRFCTNPAHRGEIYEILLLFSKSNQTRLINCVYASQNIKDDLQDAFESGDKSEFINILRNDCDYTILACRLSEVNMVYQEIKTNEEVLTCALNSDEKDEELKDMLAAQLELIRRQLPSESPASKSLNSASELIVKDKHGEDIDGLDEATNLIRQGFVHVACQYDATSLFPMEQSILASILESDDYKRMYEENRELIKQFAREQEGENETPSSTSALDSDKGESEDEDEAMERYYHVPGNFFNSKLSPESAEYLELITPLQDSKIFNEILDIVLHEGHLDPSEENMRLFVYRLTGRNRPEGELPKIEWAGQTAALFYIIKEMTTQKKGKYEKMKQYFEFRYSRSDFSQEADNASKEFRYKLNKIYSGFRLKESM